MPKTAETREIDGEVWVRVGVPGEFPSAITIWTPEEQRAFAKDHYQSGWEDAKDYYASE